MRGFQATGPGAWRRHRSARHQLRSIHRMLLRGRQGRAHVPAAQLSRQGRRARIHDQHGEREGAAGRRSLPRVDHEDSAAAAREQNRRARRRQRKPRIAATVRSDRQGRTRRIRSRGRRRGYFDPHVHERDHLAAQGRAVALPRFRRLRDRQCRDGRRHRSRRRAGVRAVLSHRRNDGVHDQHLDRPQVDRDAAVRRQSVARSRQPRARHARVRRADDDETDHRRARIRKRPISRA